MHYRPIQQPDTGQVSRCGHLGPHESRLQDAGFDTFECQALAVMRHVFLDMQGFPAAAEHINATSLGAQVFDGVRGAQVTAALIAFVQIMAMSRSANFSFSNPLCPDCASVLTPCERHMVTVLHLARRGQEGGAMAHALMLCDRAPVAGILNAAQVVAQYAPRVVRPD